MDKIRIGIFGAGAMARKHAESYKNVPETEIAGVAGARKETLERFANESGIAAFENDAELLDCIDAADICLPTFLHKETTERAAEAGINVICEKPMAGDADDASRMIEVCEDNDVKLMIAHCLQFWPEYVFLENTVLSGEFGKLFSLDLWRFGGMPSSSSRGWLAEEDRSGGPVIDLHIHDVDIMKHILGVPTVAMAEELKEKNFRSVRTSFVYEDNFPAVTALAGWYLSDGYEFRHGYRAVFENAVVEFDPLRERRLTVYKQGSAPSAPDVQADDAYVAELKYFINCLKNDEKPKHGDPEESLESLEIVLALHKFANTGKLIRFKK